MSSVNLSTCSSSIAKAPPQEPAPPAPAPTRVTDQFKPSSKLQDPKPLEVKGAGEKPLLLSPEKLNEQGIKPIDVRTEELHETVDAKNPALRTYRGFAINEIIEKNCAEAWKKADGIYFVCADGYRCFVPKDLIDRYKAYLTFATADGKPFDLVNRRHGKGEAVTLGPYYLVWDNQTHPDSTKAGTDIWPYQVVSFELVNLKEKFPKLQPEASAPEPIQRGFESALRSCMACHSYKSEGGSKQHDLFGASKRWSHDDLVRLIDQPKDLKPEATMPSFNPWLPAKERQMQITDIAAYLKYLDGK